MFAFPNRQVYELNYSNHLRACSPLRSTVAIGRCGSAVTIGWCAVTVRSRLGFILGLRAGSQADSAAADASTSVSAGEGTLVATSAEVVLLLVDHN